MKKIVLLFTSMLLYSFSFSQTIPSDSLYFGQTPPGSTPKPFAPGFVSLPGRNEAVITFSPDGSKVFFYIEKYPQPGNPYIMYSTYTDHWTVPDTIPFSVGRSAAEPFFAFNGTRLYMFATNAVNHEGIADLSYSLFQGGSWSDPVSMGDPPNSEPYQYHPCIVGDSSVWFSSGGGQVCLSRHINGSYQEREILPRPVNYIGSQTWGDPFVASDESYMLIKAIREEGYGGNDIYIAYRKTDSTWTNPKNLGPVINTPYDETSGDITPDGLYMTYGSNEDLYWVGTGFIDSLKYTNYLPYVKNPIPDQDAWVGEFFSFILPDSAFFDDDGYSTMTFSAELSSGSQLPSWLSFDPITCKFEGTPTETGILNIRVSATDTAGETCSDIFKLVISPATGLDQGAEGAFTIYPNPSSGIFRFRRGDLPLGPAKVEVFDLCGKMVFCAELQPDGILDLTGRMKGIYILRISLEGGLISQKIFLR